MIGSTIIGAKAAPAVQEVTGQNEFGKSWSEMPKRLLIRPAALVMDVAFKPTMKVLHSIQIVSSGSDGMCNRDNGA